MSDLLTLSLPLIVGPLTFLAVQGLKKGSAVLDAQGAIVKRTAALVIAFAVTVLAEKLGVASPCSVGAAEACMESLTPAAVSSLISALVAMAAHSLVKGKAAA